MQRGNNLAILLAAGEGRRMGLPKALLEYERDQSFLDHLAEVFGAAGCGVLGVIGCEAARVRAAHPWLDAVENAAWRDGGQLSSARAGLREALGRGADVLLLCPVDLPAILPSTVELVRAALSGVAEAAVPTHAGERGHPLGLTRAAAERVLEMTDAPHLEAALRRLRVREVPVEDAAVARDLDTPEEYQRFFGRPPRAVARAAD